MDAAELAIMERDDEAAQLAYAQALSDWGDAGGYEAETVWDMCTMAALGVPYEKAQWRQVRTLSGGEQKRLVLEALLRGPDEVLLLDEPDNYLDVPGKRWLEDQLRDTPKTVLFVSHDRELLAQAASVIVSVEPGPGRVGRVGPRRRLRPRSTRRASTASSGSRSCAAAGTRSTPSSRSSSSTCASTPPAAMPWPPATPPRRPGCACSRRRGRRPSRPASRTSRCGCAAAGPACGPITCAGLELTGLMKPFDLEVFYGERVAVLGSNGSGKSHFLRLLAGQDVAHTGSWKLGARVVPGFFAQTHAHPELEGRTLVGILWDLHARDRGAAMSVLRRYELERQGDQRFGNLSGGQQARFQILLLELQGSTALLLDEPTDNLDLESAEALQDGLESYEGTVLAVTHDRWFARTFDRFLVFGSDGMVREAAEPVWDETRVRRAR